jgi:DNA ligase 1
LALVTGEELITDRFPELASLRDFLPDGTVIDGEVLAYDRQAEAPLPFARLQPRIGRKSVPKKLLSEAPVILMAYDLLEWRGRDLREAPLSDRRATLEEAAAALPRDLPLRLSPRVAAEDWAGLAAARAQSREIGAEGLMLKRLGAPYLAGRKKGDWWKWKVDPLSIDAVMIYAQAGSGRRATLYTDFTFAVWNGNELVPFTKAYSGLTTPSSTRSRAGCGRTRPTASAPCAPCGPSMCSRSHFEGIQRSPRHKSGVALRFPRMARWRRGQAACPRPTRSRI